MKSEKITLTQFKKDVITELSLIKENATSEEINKLILSNFIPDNRDSCIYGLMTGNCRTTRAIELIELCCQRFVRNEKNGFILESKKFSDIAEYINGKKVDEAPLRRLEYVSSLETFIMIPKNEKHFENIFAFLNDESDSIKL